MSTKNQKPVFVIMKRELRAYLTSPVAYIVTALFLIISGILFYSTFFLYERAELRYYFSSLPILLSVFIPALTMRIFAEERRVGSIETLMTLPVTEFDVVLGKYLASFFSTLIMIAPTLFYIIPAEVFGSPDYGPIIGGFAGAIFLCASFTAIGVFATSPIAIFLCASFTAIGVFATSLTKNQIIAFFTALVICISLSMIDSFLVFLPSSIVSFFSFISAGGHFTSISRGIVDTRDLLYFISLTVLFFASTVKLQQNAKI